LATVTVPSRFNGPPTSGQGGYACALLAAHLEGPAAVSLRRPIPLDEPLEIRAAQDEITREESGAAEAPNAAARAAVRASAGSGELVAEVTAAPPPAPWTTLPARPRSRSQSQK
jgi:hypothetical protein